MVTMKKNWGGEIDLLQVSETAWVLETLPLSTLNIRLVTANHCVFLLCCICWPRLETHMQSLINESINHRLSVTSVTNQKHHKKIVESKSRLTIFLGNRAQSVMSNIRPDLTWSNYIKSLARVSAVKPFKNIIFMLNQYEFIFYKMFSRHRHLYTDFFKVSV